jgi:hypothetical protein
VNDDPAQVCPDDVQSVRQRYISAVLYFSTAGDNWLECNSAESPSINPCTGAGDPRRYLSGEDVCTWYGSNCNSAGELIRISVGKLCTKWPVHPIVNECDLTWHPFAK